MILFLSLILLAPQGYAALTIGAGLTSWQDKVPLSLNGTLLKADATYSTQGVGIGYEGYFLGKPRYRYGLSVTYNTGTLDVHQIQGVDSTRKSLQVYTGSARFLYRRSRNFAFGPMVSFSQAEIKGIDTVETSGGYLSLEYTFVNRLRLLQGFGTIGNSARFAYTLSLNKSFF